MREPGSELHLGDDHTCIGNGEKRGRRGGRKKSTFYADRVLVRVEGAWKRKSIEFLLPFPSPSQPGFVGREGVEKKGAVSVFAFSCRSMSRWKDYKGEERVLSLCSRAKVNLKRVRAHHKGPAR